MAERGNWVRESARCEVKIQLRRVGVDTVRGAKNVAGEMVLTAWQDRELGPAAGRTKGDSTNIVFQDQAKVVVEVGAVAGNKRGRREGLPVLDPVVLFISSQTTTSTVPMEEAVVVLYFGDRGSLFVGQEMEAPAWVEQHCRSRKAKTVVLQIDTEHRLCQERIQYVDNVPFGNSALELRTQWSISRTNCSSSFVRIYFRPLSELSSWGPKVVDSVTQFVRISVAFLKNDRVSSYFRRLDTDSERTALDTVILNMSELTSAEIASIGPQVLLMLNAVLEVDQLDPAALLHEKSSVLVLFTLVFSKMCSDSLADDNAEVLQMMVKAAGALEEHVLVDFLHILHSIVRWKTELEQVQLRCDPIPALPGSRVSGLLPAPVDQDMGGKDAMSVGSMESLGTPKEELESLTLALCAICLIATRSLHGNPLLERRVNWKECIEACFLAIVRGPHIDLAWRAITRLYPVCLSVAEPAVVAREIRHLFQRTILASKSKAVDFEMDLVLDCVAHLFLPFGDGLAEWAAEVLPSSEHWVHLHLVEPVVALLKIALSSRFRKHAMCSNALDLVLDGLFMRLEGFQNGVDAPYKLNAGPMSPTWALCSTWPLLEALMAMACAGNGARAHRRLFSYIDLFATAPGNLDDHREASLLTQRLYSAGEDRYRLLHLFFRSLSVALASGADIPEQALVQVVSQLLAVASDTCPALFSQSSDADNMQESMWHSMLGFFLLAARVWQRIDLAVWAVQCITQLVTRAVASLRRSMRAVEQPRPDALAFSRTPGQAVPWFVSKTTQGMVKLCCFPESASQLASAAIECLNTLMRSTPASWRQAVEAECKILATKFSRESFETGKGVRRLDRWIIRMDEMCTDKSLNEALFALRALGTALRNAPSSALLHFAFVEKLLQKDQVKISSPWLAPHACLSSKRPIPRAPKLLIPTVKQWPEPEPEPVVKQLLLALDLQRAGIDLLEEQLVSRQMRSSASSASNDQHDDNHSLLIARVVSLQIQVQLGLCSSLDDVGKDVLVRDLESIVHQLVVEQQGSFEEEEYRSRLAARNIALVEDAIKEGLPMVWSKLKELPTTRAVLEDNRMAWDLHGVGLPRVVVFDSYRDQWSLSAPHPWIPCTEFPKLALYDSPVFTNKNLDTLSSIDGSKLQGSEYAICFPGTPWRESIGEKVLSLFPAHPFEKGYVFYALLCEKSEGAGSGTSKRAVRVEVSTVRQEGKKDDYRQDRADIGVFLLPESVASVEKVSLSLAEACKQSLALSIALLRECLEHQVWLQTYDEEPRAKRARTLLHRIISAELANALSPQISQSIGYHAARKWLDQDAKIQGLCDSLLKLARISVQSLESNPELEDLLVNVKALVLEETKEAGET